MRYHHPMATRMSTLSRVILPLFVFLSVSCSGGSGTAEGGEDGLGRHWSFPYTIVQDKPNNAALTVEAICGVSVHDADELTAEYGNHGVTTTVSLNW